MGGGGQAVESAGDAGVGVGGGGREGGGGGSCCGGGVVGVICGF